MLILSKWLEHATSKLSSSWSASLSFSRKSYFVNSSNKVNTGKCISSQGCIGLTISRRVYQDINYSHFYGKNAYIRKAPCVIAWVGRNSIYPIFNSIFISPLVKNFGSLDVLPWCLYGPFWEKIGALKEDPSLSNSS